MQNVRNTLSDLRYTPVLQKATPFQSEQQVVYFLFTGSYVIIQEKFVGMGNDFTRLPIPLRR